MHKEGFLLIMQPKESTTEKKMRIFAMPRDRKYSERKRPTKEKMMDKNTCNVGY